MSVRAMIATVAGGVGLVAGVVATGAVAAVALVALGVPAEGRAEDPPSTTVGTEPASDPTSTDATVAPTRTVELVVALAPGDPVMQAGVVRGREIVLARGFEVELVRAIAARLHIPRIRFVDRAAAPRLLTGGGGPWQFALAAIRPPGVAVPTVALSTPYLTTDQLVLLRRGTARPRTLAELRTRILCGIRGTEGIRAAISVRPETPVIGAAGPARLVQLVQTGACDAALVEPVAASRLIEGRKLLLGSYAARVSFGNGLVIAVRPGTGIDVLAVNRAIMRLRADGTLARLARFWLGLDPAALPVLR
jgi:L-cystine transport system substrate-binding protein